jgi:hypothetical protein
MHRQLTRESHTTRAVSSRRIQAMSSDLVELGQQAVAEVSSGVANGAPLVKCQLLASGFYEALKRDLRATSELGVVERAMVTAATGLWRHAATASITPDMMLAELRRAIDLLQANISPSDQAPATLRRRPIFCVIEGGLSKAG